jgi:predicted DNA-binding ribbon-helix-helix protein
MQRSAIIKHSIMVSGRQTSISLENAFWKGLKEIAVLRSSTLSELVSSIGMHRQYGNLSSAIRLFVLDHFRAQAARDNARIVVSQPIGHPAGDPSAHAG